MLPLPCVRGTCGLGHCRVGGKVTAGDNAPHFVQRDVTEVALFGFCSPKPTFSWVSALRRLRQRDCHELTTASAAPVGDLGSHMAAHNYL